MLHEDVFLQIICLILPRLVCLQKTYRGQSPNIAKGLGNDELLSDLTRLFNDDKRDFNEDFGFRGPGFPSEIPKPNIFKPRPIHSSDYHNHHAPQQYLKPYSEDPTFFSNSMKPSLTQSHNPLPSKVKNLDSLIENSIGGAFYDPEHDVVVSYKVSLTSVILSTTEFSRWLFN